MKKLPRNVTVDAVVDADPEAVWAVATDPTRLGEWSHEATGAEWLGGATTATPGARFAGSNRIGRNGWVRVNEVLVADRPRRFSWRTVPAGLYRDSTVWTIDLEPVAGGTRISQRFEIVKLNPVMDRLLALVVPTHRDRREALAGDLRRLGEVAAARSGSRTAA
jgi:uncharacterized protein YndB with AHSA1/START domain